MNNLFDIHQIAEGYLRELETGASAFYQEEETPVLPLAESCLTRVVVAREEAPPYLAGIKSSGRPVFTHDMKLAASYETNSWNLEDVLSRLRIYGMSVDTMPACWYSNHQ